jgi:mevalonate kinase
LNKQFSFFSCGKLLISSEYFILDGAKGFALPTAKGQRLTIDISLAKNFELHWQSFDFQSNCWLDVILNEKHFSEEPFFESNEETMLLNVLKTARKLNPAFLNEKQNIKAKTFLDFPNNWGLGSSSTLIYNVAQWADVNPFKLLAETFGGSGYDVAVAQANAPIIFHRSNGLPQYEKVHFNPAFSEQLFFVHLNQKQNSREGILHYKQLKTDKRPVIERLNNISEKILAATSLYEFESLLSEHENIIAENLKLQKVKALHFSDYWGEIKSLGAWGGDFVLATSAKPEKETLKYFQEKGFRTVLKYKELIFVPSN